MFKKILTFENVIIVFTFLVFCFKAYVFLDPDFGWHLRMGEVIVSSGVPKTDPFSYTMPSFPFIDHEWLTNVWIYLTHTNFGYLSLSVIFSAISIAALRISVLNDLSGKVMVPGKYLSGFRTFLFLTGFGLVFSYYGIRPQVQSWLLFSILFLVILRIDFWARFKVLLPILFIFWTNLHGSFAAGVATLVAVVLFRSIRLRKINLPDVMVVVASVFATFINPYGARVWEEVYMQLSDTSLRWRIQEWQPSIFFFNLFFVLILPLSIAMVKICWKKIYLEEKILFFTFLIQGIATSRHLPLWGLITLPIVLKCFNIFYDQTKEIYKAGERIHTVLKYGFLIVFGFMIIETLQIMGGTQLNEREFYPARAVEYLKERKPEGNLFSQYGWGGYFIWKLPEKKVFIDGRMPSWRWNAGLPNEADNAMEEYEKILSGEADYKEIFEKYSVRTVLWAKTIAEEENIVDYLENRFANQLNFTYKILGIKKTDFNLVKKLESDGWQRIYEDEISVIYQFPVR